MKLATKLLGYSRGSSFSSCLSKIDFNVRNRESPTVVRAKGISKLHEPVSIKNVLLAIDPDTHGAIACCTWMAAADGDDASSVDLGRVSLKIFDMPCATVQLVKKMKKTGAQAVRR
jgi:hypothetical protein